MKKATHKLRALRGDADEVMATSASLTEAARRLGVDRSTIHRWIVAGKVSAPAGKRQRPKKPADTKPDSPTDELPPDEGWAESVRTAYELTATEAQLVDMADGARRIAHDSTEPAAVRLTAMARFAALVKQLNLEQEADSNGATQTKPDNVRQYPRRVV